MISAGYSIERMPCVCKVELTHVAHLPKKGHSFRDQDVDMSRMLKFSKNDQRISELDIVKLTANKKALHASCQPNEETYFATVSDPCGTAGIIICT